MSNVLDNIAVWFYSVAMKQSQRFRATNLAATLSRQGRRRDWLAEQVGVHPSFITHIAAGRRTVDESVAKAIAEALEESIFLLFELLDSNVSLTEEQSAELIPA